MLKVAIIDMYKGASNQGMRNIHEILEGYAKEHNISIIKNVYDIRGKGEVPDLNYDVYISSGGPGSPIAIEGWEDDWIKLIHSIILHNENFAFKKYVFLICHSFQLMCHHFKLATVSQRQSESFGIFPMHPTHSGKHNKYTGKLPDPFYAVDSRKWQVVKPDAEAMAVMGAKILAIEKERPHLPYERATMAIQFTPEIFGTQFHPEADADGMYHYLVSEEKKKVVIENYGLEKYEDMLEHLRDPDKIRLTQAKMIPVFLDEAFHLKFKEAQLT